jgi:hypothetical protein
VTAPSPHAFVPQNNHLQCSAFSVPFKVFAVVVLTLALGWAWQMATRGVLVLSWESSGWLGAALCMMLYTVWHILRGTTTLHSNKLEQTWVWHKQVALQELAYAKLIRVRGLEWLIAPRLYTKTFSNKLTVFYASDSAMLAEFQRLATELQAARLQR